MTDTTGGAKMNEALGILLGQEYADEWFKMTGRWPKYVPSEGVWGGKRNNQRKWVVFDNGN